MNTTITTTIRRLNCCVCGDDAGRFAQHWNRDRGYGICRRCIDWLTAKGTTSDELTDLYGRAGVNYAANRSDDHATN
jgi:hypothetical protein